MKKILALILALCTVIVCLPTLFAAADAPKNVFAHQTLPIVKLDAFEESYKGYVTTMGTFEGKDVRLIYRDGSDDTATKFNLYHWSTPLYDNNGDPIVLSTANYVIINYYYKSPDAQPALVGNKMRWIQGRVLPEDNISNVTEFAWGTNIMSRKGMVANKWDTLVMPFDEYLNTIKTNLTKNKEYYLQQMKLFPLERDMGKEDILYIGDIVFQSWDPDQPSGISERTVAFFANPDDDKYPEKAVSVIKAKDIESIVIPEYTSKSPENREFISWKNTVDGKDYYPGEVYRLLLGCDVNFVPNFNYIFDFSGNESAYINGYEDGSFKPQNNVTRAEAIKILASIIDSDEGKNATSSFEDVAPTDWFYPYVTKLEALGALSIWEGKLEPQTQITRSELVEIVYAISDINRDSIKLTYVSDISSQQRFYDAVMYAMAEGIITGYEDGSFKPNNKITRAETVTIVNRVLKRVWNGEGASKFSDIEGHWAKGQIIASASAKAENTWTVNTAAKEYVLEGTNAEGYIKSLHAQAKNLSGDAIRRGIDAVSEQMKKDILSTPNTAELYPEKIGKNTYYVSEKNGNDDNDGKSPEKAVKTIAGLYKKIRFPGKGTAILFERGGVYRGQISVISGITYGAYGVGSKPIISGSKKNYADASLWEQTDAPNVYKLTDSLTNVGIIVFDHAADPHGNYHDLFGKNRIYGKNIAMYSDLTKDLEFFSEKDTLYLCSTSGNPGSRFTSIEIGTRVDIFDGSASDITIDNLHIKHTGSHGVGLSSGNNVLVSNCEFSWLGGSLLGSFGETTTQYGNAVELYGNCDGFYVRNNWMWQIYDTAITHQGKDLVMKDVQYSSNLMEYCYWGIESWLTQPSRKDCLHEDFLAQYNVLRDGGYGWGSIVTDRDGMLFGFYNIAVENRNLHTEFNIIDRCSGEILNIDSRANMTFDSNIYVQDEGKEIGNLKGRAAVAGKDSAQLIYDRLKDKNLIAVVVSAH